jgi:hypothetical protein
LHSDFGASQFLTVSSFIALHLHRLLTALRACFTIPSPFRWLLLPVYVRLTLRRFSFRQPPTTIVVHGVVVSVLPGAQHLYVFCASWNLTRLANKFGVLAEFLPIPSEIQGEEI